MASTYLTRSLASTNTSWTFSAWIKRSGLSGTQYLTSWGNSGTDGTGIGFNGSGTLYYYSEDTTNQYKVTSSVYRDTSAWYHIVCKCDSNAITLYVNGEEPTQSWSTGSAANPLDTSTMAIGKWVTSNYYFDGSMAHVHFIDGTAYNPSTFGETESNSGIWKPKTSPSVTYGTNGFFLKFQDSSSLGDDSSGNTNDLTLSGSGKQILDTPSNVFCTANPLSKGSNVALTNGNLTITKGSGFESCMATLMPSAGKWYWENKVVSLGTVNAGVTKFTQDGTTHSRVDAGRSMYSSNGTIYNEGLSHANISTGTTFTTGDIIGVALDIDNDEIKYYKNGTLVDTVDDSGIGETGWSPAWGLSGGAWDCNFGNGYFGTTAITSPENDDAGYGKFEYDVPAGYYALCTKNINNYG